MSEYLPPLRPATNFNLVDFVYQDKYVTNKDIEYAIEAVNNSDSTQLANIASLQTKTTNQSYGAGTTTFTGTVAFSNDLSVNGSQLILTVPKVSLTAGTNKSIGSATLVNGVVTISNTRVTSSSLIFLSRGAKNASTGIGNLQISTITDVTSFIITSLKDDATTQTLDLSTVNWLIINYIVINLFWFLMCIL